MKTHRCFHDGALASGDVVVLADVEAHHLLRVRRARDSDRLLVLNGQGEEFEARLIDARARSVEMAIGQCVRREAAPPPLPILAPVLTPDSESIVAVAVELGVSAFRPLISARCTIPGAGKKSDGLVERWRRLAISAIKQCERLWLPVIHPTVDLRAGLGQMKDSGERPVCLIERAPSTSPLLDLIEARGPSPLCFVIGPEGGWDDSEHQLFAESSLDRASLGSAILRAESAALCSLASSLAHRGRVGD